VVCMTQVVKVQKPWYVEVTTDVKKHKITADTSQGREIYEYGRITVLVPKDWVGRKVKVIVVPVE